MRRAAIAALLVCARAGASPLELFGFGGRSPALGGTGAAIAEDFDCAYANPAGLGDVRRKRFSVGTLVGTFSLTGSDRPVDNAYGVELGMALPIPLGGALANRIGLGVAAYIPTQVLNRARAPAPDVPFFVLLENRSEVVGLNIALGVRASERWSFGAGVLVLAALRGRIDVVADAAGRFATVSEQQLISGFSPVFGARFRATDDLTLAATLRIASKSTYDIEIDADLAEALPVTLPVLHVKGTAQYDPLTAAIEAAWRSGALLLVGQLGWQHWSAFPNPTENPVASMPERAGPGFHDTLVPRLGVEWTVPVADVAVALRGGAFFAPSPAPDGPLLDNHRLGLTAGAGFLVDPLRVDVWFQAQVLVGRSQDDIATSGAVLAGGLVVGLDL
jgi:long-chain fatty acid transport protein